MEMLFEEVFAAIYQKFDVFRRLMYRELPSNS